VFCGTFCAVGLLKPPVNNLSRDGLNSSFVLAQGATCTSVVIRGEDGKVLLSALRALRWCGSLEEVEAEASGIGL
jgi:hypothetical protein